MTDEQQSTSTSDRRNGLLRFCESPDKQRRRDYAKPSAGLLVALRNGVVLVPPPTYSSMSSGSAAHFRSYPWRMKVVPKAEGFWQ